MIQKLIVKGRLTDLNEYTAACRGNRYGANNLKHQNENRIISAIIEQSVKPVKQPVWLRYTWYEATRRRDHDNVAFAQKFVQDALVKAFVLEGDGWAHVTGFAHRFDVDKSNPRVEIEIIPVEKE